jgi:hypothetical protein
MNDQMGPAILVRPVRSNTIWPDVQLQQHRTKPPSPVRLANGLPLSVRSASGSPWLRNSPVEIGCDRSL